MSLVQRETSTEEEKWVNHAAKMNTARRMKDVVKLVDADPKTLSFQMHAFMALPHVQAKRDHHFESVQRRKQIDGLHLLHHKENSNFIMLFFLDLPAT